MEDQQIIQEIDKLNLKIGETNSAIIKYLDSLEKFDKKCKDTEKQKNGKMIEIYQRKESNKNSIFELY